MTFDLLRQLRDAALDYARAADRLHQATTERREVILRCRALELAERDVLARALDLGRAFEDEAKKSS